MRARPKPRRVELHRDLRLGVEAEGPALVEGVARAIGRLLDDGETRLTYRAAAQRVLTSYVWADTARRVIGCLEEAAGA